jgi:hypothetical protein
VLVSGAQPETVEIFAFLRRHAGWCRAG